MGFLNIDWVRINDAHNRWMHKHRLTQQDLFGVMVGSIPFAGTILSTAFTIHWLIHHRKDQDLKPPVAELRIDQNS